MANIRQGLPGYEFLEFEDHPVFAGTEDWSAEQWQADFEKTLRRVTLDLRIHDPYIVLAQTASLYIHADHSVELPHTPKQTDIEITQALLLLAGKQVSTNPISPDNLIKYWDALRRHLRGFIRKAPITEKQTAVEHFVSRHARLQTLYYRNIFSREDCERVLTSILSRIDGPSETALGFKLSELFAATFMVTDVVQERFLLFTGHRRRLIQATHRRAILECLEFFRSAYPVAKRTWRNCEDHLSDLETLRRAVYQISEQALPWIFQISRQTVEEAFSRPIVDAIYCMAIAPGSLSSFTPEHIYLNNPIWTRPYILRKDGSLFAAFPQLIISFPFLVMEAFMQGHSPLELAYEHARSRYLEETIATLISTALPSAIVYSGVVWDDPNSGQLWENDVLAAIGNFIFVFEAKSGRIKDASRRGGMLSLRTNFKELFVDPGVQSGRLQKYLDTAQREARVRLKSTGELIDLNLDRPKVVFTFSICIEHFATLTSARHYLKELGLVSELTPWAPVLSLGELQIIARFLDSEVSFQHYLTRRATLEQVMDFEGDEQDILSAYLTNGLWVDKDSLDGHRVIFFGSDSPVRRPKVARQDRTVVELHGNPLPPLWHAIVDEVYGAREQRHRFDIINVILNQTPFQLADIERRIRRFRRGVPLTDGDLAYAHFSIGDKVFALAVHFCKRPPDPEAWKTIGRDLTASFRPLEGSIECAVVLILRRSRENYDGISFYRQIFRPPSDQT